MSNVKGYSLKYNIYVHFVFFFRLDKIVEVQTIYNIKYIGFTNYVVYILINSALIGR